MNNIQIGTIGLICYFISASLYAEPLRLESGVSRNALIELYTSEGCSSCPPAEKYLNSLKHSDSLWETHVPVAFHVDYWDYIGWVDRFAHKRFGARQSRYAKLFHVSTVYTPAFLVNGVSWRRGIFFSSEPKIPEEKTGNLRATINNSKLKVDYQYSDEKTLELHVALLGMGLTTQIERGENAGNKAQHEFVVVGYDRHLSTGLNWQVEFPRLHVNGVTPKAVAIWVSKPGNPTPLQVVGGYLK